MTAIPDVFTKAKRSEVVSRIRERRNKEAEIALARGCFPVNFSRRARYPADPEPMARPTASETCLFMGG